MPRLPASLLRQAAARDVHLPRLLRECRDLESATNELRWLADHAYNHEPHHRHHHHHQARGMSPNARLMQYVRRRSRGEPLQYILGTQPFGELDILCRKNVLIPRLETELYTAGLARVLRTLRQLEIIRVDQSISIADLCTGTGCIALLLHSLLDPPNLQGKHFSAISILAADVSSHALGLARQNLMHNLDAGLLNPSCTGDISFEYLDILHLGHEAKKASSSSSIVRETLSLDTTKFTNRQWDVIISNPPYIAPSDYAPGGTVGRSVRDHEPKLALVPPPLKDGVEQRGADQADQFYEALLHVARTVQSKLLVMEVGDSRQARRVRGLASKLLPASIWVETWRDDGSVDSYEPCTSCSRSLQNTDLAPERVVVVWAGSWAEWRMKESAEDKRT